jgi:N-acetylated-alpha-linked acidic dipeptidase
LMRLSEKLYQTGKQCDLDLSQTPSKNAKEINKILISLEIQWISEQGNPFGKWYKSLYVSSDPNSGYASWMMPAFMHELSQQSTKNLKEWESKYAAIIEKLNEMMNKISVLAK